MAESTWSQEKDKWDHLEKLKISKILGDRKTREIAAQSEADIYVINRENLAWLVENFDWKWDCVIIDELSSFKNPGSKRFKALKKVLGKIKRIYGLTGTPAPNGLLDLWAQVFLLDKGRALGRSISAFRQKYFTRINPYLEFENNKNYKPKNKRAYSVIIKRLENFCIHLKNSDYIDLPEITYSNFNVTLDDKAKKQYRLLERNCLLSLDEEEITAFNMAALTNKLLQIASGQVYDEDKGVHAVHPFKLEALEEIIEAAGKEPVLVFYNFQHERDLILKHFKEARLLEGDKDITDWNAGKIPILLAHPASTAYGLNMQDGGRIIVWFSPTWNLEYYEQANARLHRQGQGKPVRVVHIIAKDTIDETVMKALESKDKTQTVLLEALKNKYRLERAERPV